MKSGIVIKESEEYGYILELWGASTKHPDSVFHFSDWQDKVDWIKDEYQIMQWLFYCASRLNFPFYAQELAEYAIKNYSWDKN